MDCLGDNQRDILGIGSRGSQENTGTFAQPIYGLDALASGLQALLDAVIACAELLVNLLGSIECKLCRRVAGAAASEKSVRGNQRLRVVLVAACGLIQRQSIVTPLGKDERPWGHRLEISSSTHELTFLEIFVDTLYIFFLHSDSLIE